MSSDDALWRNTSSSCDVESLELAVEAEGSFMRGLEQGGKSPFSLLSEPIFPSSLLLEPISPSPFSFLKSTIFFLPPPYFFPLFLPPPNFFWAISPSSLFCSSPLFYFDRSALSSREVGEGDVTEEDEDDGYGIRFVTLESRFENKETVINR